MRRQNRSLFAWIGGTAAAVIVLASVFVSRIGPADPAADVGDQRAAVARFHELVRRQAWSDVYRLMTEPPTREPDEFADLMGAQVRANGRVVAVRMRGMRLLRSRTVPLLEVRESVTTTKDGRTATHDTVSYFARRAERWLFAFSAPA
jgi:hypothetical protein